LWAKTTMALRGNAHDSMKISPRGKAYLPS
jgi:hypothetical protein